MSEVITQEQQAQIPAMATPSQMLMKAVERGADLEQISKFMDLQERWQANQAKSEYLQAMSDFQAECPVIVAKKQGHNYKYAPIGDIIAQVKNLLSKHGISYRFEQSQQDNNIEITCVVSHRSGHSEKLTMSGKPDSMGQKSGIQASGSTVTYLRRYTLTGALGIVTADEDSDGRVQSSKPVVSVDQLKEINDLISKIGMAEKVVVNAMSSKLNISIQNFAQLYSEQADFVINELKKKVAQ